MTSVGDMWRYELRVGNSPDPARGACVMDAVSWFEYGALGDEPACTCPVQAAWMRLVNDVLPDDARQALRRFIPRLAGTVDPGAEVARHDYLARQVVTVLVPLVLRATGDDDVVTVLRRVDIPTATWPHRIAALLSAAGKITSADLRAGVHDMARHGFAGALDFYLAPMPGMVAALRLRGGEPTFVWSGTVKGQPLRVSPVVADDGTGWAKWVKAVLAATDGVLSIGRRAPEVELARFAAAVESFGRAAAGVPA